MKPGQIRYGLVCQPDGGILDDVLVYRLSDGPGSEEAASHQVVVNASNREKIVDWFAAHVGSFDVSLDDVTTQTAMIAVQGPHALAVADALVDADLATMKYYTGGFGNVAGHPCLVSRTGYTGEDGCELIVAAEDAQAVWEVFLGAGAAVGAKPAGLGARDTLRLEAAMPLYGHELSEQINPVQAGLTFALNLKDRDFLGRDAIVRFKKDPTLPVRIGLALDGKRVAREGAALFSGGDQVGEVTSGTFSPTLEKPIAMAYVPPAAAEPGMQLTVDVRGKVHRATVVELPFYARAR
jgi:aminomethyltransferase